MKFYGDLTKKLYNTMEDCEKAEKKFKAKLDEAEAKKKELADAKAARAKEVTEAYKRVREAQKEYEKLRGAFIQDYGFFHLTYTDKDERTPFSIFEDFFTF